MPELPTVDAFRRYLIKEKLIGNRITSVDVSWPRSIISPNHDRFLDNIKDGIITSIDRRGKWLFLVLDKGILGIHLRMTGSLFVVGNADDRTPYVRTTFDLQDGRKLLLSDPRKFGKLWFGDDNKEILAKLGPEPVNELLESHADFRFDEFSKHFIKRNIFFKTLLLDQAIVAGIGNIYADEILLHSKLSPFVRTSDLNKTDIEILFERIVIVIGDAITDLDLLLKKGVLPVGNEESKSHFKLPRFIGGECQICGSQVAWTKINGRGTYYCEKCQA